MVWGGARAPLATGRRRSLAVPPLHAPPPASCAPRQHALGLVGGPGLAGRGGEEGKASGSSVEGVMIIWMGAMEQDSSSPEGKATVKVLHLVVAVVKVVGGGGFVDLHRRAPAHRQGTQRRSVQHRAELGQVSCESGRRAACA